MKRMFLWRSAFSQVQPLQTLRFICALLHHICTKRHNFSSSSLPVHLYNIHTVFFCIICSSERQDFRSNSLYSKSTKSSVSVPGAKEPDLLLVDLRANSAFDDGFLLGPGNVPLPASYIHTSLWFDSANKRFLVCTLQEPFPPGCHNGHQEKVPKSHWTRSLKMWLTSRWSLW
jgi:hypothetical protein